MSSSLVAPLAVKAVVGGRRWIKKKKGPLRAGFALSARAARYV